MEYKLEINFDSYDDVFAMRNALTSLLAEHCVKYNLSALDYKRLAGLRDQFYAKPRLEKDNTFKYLGYTFEFNDCRYNGDCTDRTVCFFMQKYDDEGNLLPDRLVPWFSYGADDIIKEGKQVPDSLLEAIDKMLEADK